MKMIILLAFALTLSIFAFEAEVKKENVSLLINDRTKTYDTGSKFSLKGGDLVCFVSGNGRVVIKGDKYSKQLSRHSTGCKRLPVANKEQKDYLALVNERLVEHFGEAQETAVSGVSTRSVSTAETVTETLKIPHDVKYVIVGNDTWGPLPVTVKVLDGKGEVIASETNEEELVTSFVFPTSVFKEGYMVEVSNAFDELVLKSSVHFQNRQKK